jgi:hypothetical protein
MPQPSARYARYARYAPLLAALLLTGCVVFTCRI